MPLRLFCVKSPISVKFVSLITVAIYSGYQQFETFKMYKQLRKELEDGDIPLLTRSQLYFLDEVNTVVDNKICNNVPWYVTEDEDRTFDVMLEISTMEKNLSIIIKQLKGARLAKLRFAETYPKFKRNREDCIVQLKEIADSLDKDRFNCNVSKLVGYCTSFVGGAITIASAIAIPFTLGLSTPLAIAGGTVTAAGCGTAIGTSITEVALLKTKVDKAKELIEADKNYFENNMSDWLNHATDLQEALSSVLNINILEDIAESIKEFVEKAIAIRNDQKRIKFIEKAVTKLINEFVPKLAENAVPILAIATIITILVTVFLLLLNTQNRLVFDCASLTIRSIVGIASLVDNSMDVFRLSSLFAGNAAVAKNFAKAVTRGAVATIGMVLDVAGIVLTSIDIHKGSQTPEAEKIIDAAISMREEADVLERVYNSLSPTIP